MHTLKETALPKVADIYEIKRMADSMIFTKRQMEYLYLPVNEVENPTATEIDSLMSKIEQMGDNATFLNTFDKWKDYIR